MLPSLFFSYGALISGFHSSSDSFQDTVAKAGRIVRSACLKEQIHLAHKGYVLILNERFQLDDFKELFANKVGHCGSLSQGMLFKTLQAIQAIYPRAIDDFDSILITHNGVPVFVYINSSKLDFLSITQKQGAEFDLESAFYIGAPKEKLLLAFKQLKDYSFSINVNHHFNDDVPPTRPSMWLLLGGLVVGAFMIQYLKCKL